MYLNYLKDTRYVIDHAKFIDMCFFFYSHTIYNYLIITQSEIFLKCPKLFFLIVSLLVTFHQHVLIDGSKD